MRRIGLSQLWVVMPTGLIFFSKLARCETINTKRIGNRSVEHEEYLFFSLCKHISSPISNNTIVDSEDDLFSEER